MNRTGALLDAVKLRAITNPAYYPLYGCSTRNLILMGGAGSGKSVFATQKIAVRIMTEPGHSMIAFRKIGATLRESVFAEFKSTLSALGVAPLWDVNKTELSFTFRPNGGRLRCMGLDDQEKLKSIARLTSAWIEEATEFVPNDYEQINLRLRGRPARNRFGDGPSYRQILVSFNPISSLHWLKKYFFDSAQHGRTRTLRTTYRHNAFIDEQYRSELEALALRDPLWAAVYVRGEWGVLKGAVYAPWPVANPWPDHFHDTIYGLDFGFNAPCALVECNEYDQDWYLRELIYTPGLTTGDLVDRMESLGVSKDAMIYADSAEPDRIEEIARAGFNVHPASKGQGSLKAGIDFLRKQTIYTRDDNANLNAENNTYSWKKTKNGDYIDEPEKANDHSLDAVRYAIHTHSTGAEAPDAGGADLDVSPE